MTTDTDEFACHVDQWKLQQCQPWGQLRYSTSRLNIERHTGNRRLRVLDIGGGNGVDSIYFAQKGHCVTLLDGSVAMLAAAENAAKEKGVAERLTIHQADVDSADLRLLFEDERFDLILCHLMIEFVDDARVLFQQACELLAPRGLISVLDVNRYSEPFVQAFLLNDLSKAIESVGARKYLHPWVNRLTPRFSADEFIDQLKPNGCVLAGHYGVTCFTAYLPNEPKYDPQYFAELERLEHRLTDTYPYYLTARNFQVIGRKS